MQTTYRMHLYQQVVSDLSAQQVQLTNQQASRPLPGRVAAWARANGMVMPGSGDTVVLPGPRRRVRGARGGANP